MPPLTRGAYERLVTSSLEGALAAVEGGLVPELVDLRDADAADRLALHLARVVERAVESVPESKRAAVGAALSRRLIGAVVRDAEVAAEGGALEALTGEQPSLPPQVLRALRAPLPDGRPESISQPLIPLLDTTLLTNAPGEPNVGHQIQAEIDSADGIDLVMAFIRRSGVRQFREALLRHRDRGRRFRVLTTTYTGSTEAAALDLLQELGAEVRVSYDTSGTRLHAKAWVFHRTSGFTTAYVGSSNLTHSAQVTGLEWNVRLSEARNRPAIEKLAAVFESYWQQPDFEAYDRTRFLEATRADDRTVRVVLSPTEIRLEPFQERLLEQIEVSRSSGNHRNLLVSATGTGKTVMAAIDYARLQRRLPRARLLFVAHREEILEQAQATFAHALREPGFGERWVAGQRPARFDHVFASIQSLSSNGLAHLAPDHFDVVIVDEFHHAAAESYRRVLEVLQPRELLGLTATPERSDGRSVLEWFGGRIAATLRLWDAIDQHRLVPFSYLGIADSLDLRNIPWQRGRGYEIAAISNLLTGSEIWARQVLSKCLDHLGSFDDVRALGFCVSVAHARHMARIFRECGIEARAVTAESSDEDRRDALRALDAGRIKIVFSVDLFNEGVDVPNVDTLLMLRPTDSPLLFIQQLGRGLRKATGKSLCTVLDFVGHHRREFRFDRRLGALLGASRRQVQAQVEQGFPFLPAGCQMQLEPVARERILENIRQSIPTRRDERARDLARMARDSRADVTLASALEQWDMELSEFYRGPGDSWSGLRELAGLPVLASGPHESVLRRAIGRLLHADDPERLHAWRTWLDHPDPAAVAGSGRESRLIRALLAQVLESVKEPSLTFAEGASLLAAHPQVCRELGEVCELLGRSVDHLTTPLPGFPDVPLRVHAHYTRREILVACGIADDVKGRTWREGVLFARDLPADLLAFTLDKTDGSFSPSTRYKDYAISRELIHWESQSTTRAESETGLRYREHAARGSHVWLFARARADERAFVFLGPARFVGHHGEQPMGITWRLEVPLPGDLFQAFAAAVA